MSWRSEKTKTGQDLIWDGVEMGIAPSPTLGTANIQNANIATETGEVLASYGRVAQQQLPITDGTLTPDGSTNFTGPANLKVGAWITVSASTVTSINTTTSPSVASVDYLVVGGGGGGGGATDGGGGGGGGGEVATGSSNVAIQNYTITVGLGGDGGSTSFGTSGGTSSFGAIDNAIGGAGGGVDGGNGQNGSSGGGGGGDASTSGTGGTGSAGNNGGNGFASGTLSLRAGGGGGGSSGAGTNATSGQGGNGGNGTSSSITGTATIYGAGGGGGSSNNTAGEGGNSGLGGAGNGGSDSNGFNAEANRGGGGGGAGDGTDIKTGGDGGSGIVVIAYTLGTMVAIGGNISIIAGKVIHTFNSSGTFKVISINKTNIYYVSYKSGTTFKLSAKFDPTGANAITHGTTGTVTFSILTVPNQGVAKATEKYDTSTGVEYRYYILDKNSYVWVFDSLIYETYGTQWMLPDPMDYSALRLTGIGVLNGLVVVVGMAFIVGKPNTDLGRAFTALGDVYLNEPFPTHNNFAMVGNQGKLYYCDGNYIGSVFPTTSIITSIANIQSECSYTATTTTGTVSSVISGSLPYSPDGTRIPVVFFTDVYGTQPTNLIQSEIYYIQCDPTAATFQVFSSSTGLSPIDIASGAAGNQFFTTFWPYGEGAVSSDTPLVQVSTQRLNLPSKEVAQCMVEIGNLVLIGGITNTVYPWNQVDATPSDFIELPESGVKTMLNANNMAYIFAGNKGNIYISNGTVASLAVKVPDYVAGVPASPLTYIEPYYTWGDSMYMRGRVYFSILDQTATKSGNAGGVWSFIPSQNIDPSQEVGIALRLENQNSYGDYDGVATILIPNEEQMAVSPQYWASWQDSYSVGSSTFGIDYTSSTPVTQYIVETDMLKTGSFIDQQTFSQVEYDLTTPLASEDAVQLYYRLNSTDAWTTCGTVNLETSNPISGYFKQVFQKTQWVQFRAVCTTGSTTASSFVRLKQIRLR